MLVVTNRAVNAGKTDETAFGEKPNVKGPNELRFAHATKSGGKWKVEVVPEPKKLDRDNLPSKREFLKLLATCRKTGRHALFFIHGYNKTFLESLEQGWLLQSRYKVELVLFSWPANPGGLIPKEYREARRIAQASFGALDAALAKFSTYMRPENFTEDFDRDELLACDETVNLLAYSMGGYLLQNYITSNAYEAETRAFANIILCQTDVDNPDHEDWVEKTVTGQRVYVTINENDKVLAYSNAVNPPRLGNTLRDLEADNATYVDFTEAAGVGTNHQLWGEVASKNVIGFFAAAFTGRRAEDVPGLRFDPRLNAFRMA